MKPRDASFDDDLVRNENSVDIVNCTSEDYDDIVPIEEEDNKQDDAPPEEFVEETPRESRECFTLNQPTLNRKPSKNRLEYAN